MTRRFSTAIICFFILSALFSCAVQQRTPATIRVMTWNLHHCEGEDGVYNVGRIADFMKNAGADIILCQEVDRGYSDRSNMERQPEMLAEKLGYHFFYGPNIGDTYGNLILSRFPIEKADNITLPNPENKEPRGVIVSTVSVNGVRLTVLDTHLSAFEQTNRIEQIAFLREMVKKMKSPMIFGADFNTRPSQQLKPLLEDGVVTSTRDTILTLGEGIDDILVSADLKRNIVKGEVVENVLSDHPAYWIDVVIR